MCVAEEFQRLAGQLQNEKPAYVLAELNDLLANAPGPEIELLSAPSIADPAKTRYALEDLMGANDGHTD